MLRLLAAQLEAAALLLLHLRDDALKRQLEDDRELQKWLKELLLRLQTAYECHSTETYPLPQTTQKYGEFNLHTTRCSWKGPSITIADYMRPSLQGSFSFACFIHMLDRLLLRVFLRLSRLQVAEQQLQQLLSLPCSACLDVCLCWEAADPALCYEVAATLLTSLKPTKRQRLVAELRESVLCAIEASRRSLEALSRRPDCPLVYSPLSTVGGHSALSSWQEAAAATLQPLIEALATLRVATCCLPLSFALELWDRGQKQDCSLPSVEAVLKSFREPEAPTPAQSPFSAPLRAICAALTRPPWFSRSSPLLPPSLQQAAVRGRTLACCCLVGDAAAQSRDVREELRAGGNRRPSRRLQQRAEELLQDWGASLLQLFEGCSADGGATQCIVGDLEVSGIRCLLQQWRLADVFAELEIMLSHRDEDQIDYIDTILSTSKTGEDETMEQPTAPLEMKTSLALTSADATTVRQLQEMLPGHGPGYLYLALRELEGNAEEVVSLLMENMKPANLRDVPLQATLQDAADFIDQEKQGAVPELSKMPQSADIQRQVLALAERAAAEDLEGSEDTNSLLYDDDADEELLQETAAARWSPEESEAEESSSSNETEQEDKNAGHPLRSGSRMPVRGGTLAARRKETNKASIGNHSRRNQRRRKIERCMGP
ncbi:uncharacterized protein EMH_0007350 [Eimeria mitis]|uniref:CUE domain-containing protein n=1 Tax=Eimeria mitis TaxID=44415 RepID=U6JSX8_9EIME|nr:uncharacterized protein EMH_0007350 [Eimeria mitis]CDJ27162.1 hypothetical protein, conserved [Eimeria mitis]